MPGLQISGTSETALREMLVDTDEFVLISPTINLLNATIAVTYEQEQHPTIQVLTSESVLRTFRDDFTYAWLAADLIAEGTLTELYANDEYETPLAVADDTVWTIGEVGDITIANGTNDVDLADEIRNKIETDLDGPLFDLRTPARSLVLETAKEEFSLQFRDDFETAIETLGGIGDQNLDAIHVAILIAAANEGLLYDLGNWTEDVGIGSRASVSRKKDEIGELITTEKVPADVGRPRLRLKLVDDLVGSDIEEIVEIAIK